MPEEKLPDIPALRLKKCKICGQKKPAFAYYKTSTRCRRCASDKARESHLKTHPPMKKYPKIRWYD